MRLLLSIPFLAIGFWLAYWIKKRQITRTNQYGVEEFPTPRSKAISNAVDKVALLIAMIFVLIGIILVL